LARHGLADARDCRLLQVIRERYRIASLVGRMRRRENYEHHNQGDGEVRFYRVDVEARHDHHTVWRAVIVIDQRLGLRSEVKATTCPVHDNPCPGGERDSPAVGETQHHQTCRNCPLTSPTWAPLFYFLHLPRTCSTYIGRTVRSKRAGSAVLNTLNHSLSGRNVTHVAHASNAPWHRF
jgi:hypothetical protein